MDSYVRTLGGQLEGDRLSGILPPSHRLEGAPVRRDDPSRRPRFLDLGFLLAKPGFNDGVRPVRGRIANDVIEVEEVGHADPYRQIARPDLNVPSEAARRPPRWPFVPSGESRLRDRKSTRLNSSHGSISYAVF